MSFKHISVQDSQKMLAEGKAISMDIRDPQSFESAHIDGAVHLTNDNLQQVVTETDTAQPIIIYCYHGISSQNAAQYFVGQGFEEVYSMDGGFEAWRNMQNDA